uniref:EVE domain-containing protein n=1 Tax=Rhodosorus marinus TaxID=101924 RepID=A0A7S3A720_9RHOD|mmetsp:Transcript_5803/g.24437  ORF Transcript_5803/g.24437 Transcript_5803/m.24437 type:complete len:307 (+) Transcript_5803:1612-2532(+)
MVMAFCVSPFLAVRGLCKVSRLRMVRTRSRGAIDSGEGTSNLPVRKKRVNASGSGPSEELVNKHDPVSEEKRTVSEERRYFLLKSEAESRIVAGQEVKFSIDDLENMPEQTSHWDGVRNYQARNIMREMKKGDFAFFYHSNCKPAGIVGLVTVVKEGYPDHTQFDEKSLYYDAKSTPEDPRWFMVDVKLYNACLRRSGNSSLRWKIKKCQRKILLRSSSDVAPLIIEKPAPLCSQLVEASKGFRLLLELEVRDGRSHPRPPVALSFRIRELVRARILTIRPMKIPALGGMFRNTPTVRLSRSSGAV